MGELADRFDALIDDLASPKIGVQSRGVADIDRLRMAIADVERDHDALLVAVSELLGRGADIVFLDRVTEMTDPMIGNVTALVADSCRLETEAPIARDARPGWYVAILAPSSAPNPELLERASTMLAEAYIAATTANPPAATAADGSVKP